MQVVVRMAKSFNSECVVRSLLPLLVGVVVVLLLVCPSCAGDNVLTTTLDVQAADSAGYGAFMVAFDKNVNATTKATSGKWINKHPVLGEQKPWQGPAYWLHVLVKDTKGTNQVTLAVRSDNLYLCGFRNNHGEWFVFKGYDKIFPHRSTPLGYGSGYPDLFKDVGYTGMGRIGVNKAEAVRHLVSLATYRAGAGPDEALKVPLAFFILVVSEAERFQPIRDRVSQVWDSRAPQAVQAGVIKLLVQWARTSCALLAWDKYGRSDRTWRDNTEAGEIKKSVGIKSPDEALSTINAVLMGRKCSWKH